MNGKEAVDHIDSEKNLVNMVHLPFYRGGREIGSKHLDDNVRSIIGSIANVSESKSEVARALGVERKMVSEYSLGQRHDGTVNGSLKEKVVARTQALAEKVENKLNLFLDKVNPIEMDGLGLKDKVSATKDLSTIVKNLRSGEGRLDVNVGAGGKVIMMSYPDKKETDYDVVEIQAVRVETKVEEPY